MSVLDMALVLLTDIAPLGVGLAMDAFSVSVVNGFSVKNMERSGRMKMAGAFGFFQCLMPLIGWALVNVLLSVFRVLNKYIPWVAMALLFYLGGKMVYEGIRGETEEMEDLGRRTLLLQSIATSIDALSAGIVLSAMSLHAAVISSVLIGLITFAFCVIGALIGKKFGTKLAGRATILGGIILIFIGIKIAILR